MSESYKIYASRDYVDERALPGGATGYQQLVTDGEGNKVWEDRLAWKASESKTLFDGTPVLIRTSYGMGMYQIGDESPNNIELYPNKTYTIVFDGTTYANLQPQSSDRGISVMVEHTDDSGDPTPVMIITDSTRAENNPGTYLEAMIPGEENHTLILIEHSEAYKTIDPEYLPDGIGYKIYGADIEIFPETVLSESPAYIPSTFAGFVEGSEYTIIFNDTTYKCTAYMTAGGPSMPCVGNGELAYLDGGNREPFFITVVDGQIILFANIVEEYYTISIYGRTVTTHKIPNEYLPPYVKRYVLGNGESPLTKNELYIIKGEFDGGNAIVSMRGHQVVSMGFTYDTFKLVYYVNPSEGISVAHYEPNADGLYDLNARPNEWGYQELYAESVRLFGAVPESSAYYNACHIDQKCAVLMSSTPDSTKKFRITVDDNGKVSTMNTEDLSEVVMMPEIPVTASDNGKILGVVDGKIEPLETNSNSYSLSTEPAIQIDDEVVQTEYIKLLTNNETEVSKLGPYVTDYGFSALKDQIWGIEQAATIAFQNEAEIKPIREIASEQDVSYFQTVTAPYLQGIGRTLYGDEFNGQDFTGLKTIRQIVGELTAADLGLSGAMKFQGVVTTLPTSSTAGSVVLMGNKEYVYDSNGNWIELGDEGSHALKTITITAGSGLTGGGTLEANRTIAHSNVITAGTAKGGSGTLTAGGTFTVPSISYDANGHITGATTTTYTLPAVMNINNITQTTGDELILDCN